MLCFCIKNISDNIKENREKEKTLEKEIKEKDIEDRLSDLKNKIQADMENGALNDKDKLIWKPKEVYYHHFKYSFTVFLVIYSICAVVFASVGYGKYQDNTTLPHRMLCTRLALVFGVVSVLCLWMLLGFWCKDKDVKSHTHNPIFWWIPSLTMGLPSLLIAIIILIFESLQVSTAFRNWNEEELWLEKKATREFMEQFKPHVLVFSIGFAGALLFLAFISLVPCSCEKRDPVKEAEENEYLTAYIQQQKDKHNAQQYGSITPVSGATPAAAAVTKP